MKHMTGLIISIVVIGLITPWVGDAKENHNKSVLTWQIQKSNTTSSLRGICAVNDTVAWASGSSGTIVKTTDGGSTWTLCPVKGVTKLDFRDVQAFDAQTALVISAGSPAKIYKTTNGGKSWQETYSNTHPGIFFDSMAFWDKSNGVAFSDPIDNAFFVITTTDGGNSWQRVPPQNLPKPLPKEAGFAASGTCITVQGSSNAWFCTGGGAARVIYSTDKGNTWNASNTPIISGNPSEGCFSIAFKNSTYGYVVGGDYKAESKITNNAAYTADGGKSWTLIGKNKPQGFRECVLFVPALGKDVMLTVGPSGSEYSTDNGLNWRSIDVVKGFHSAANAPGTRSVWAVGTKGLIAQIRFKVTSY